MGQLFSFPSSLVKKEAKKDPQISALLKKIVALHKAGGIESLVVLYKPPDKPFESVVTGKYLLDADKQLDLFSAGVQELHLSGISLAIKRSRERIAPIIGQGIDNSIFGACMFGSYLDAVNIVLP